VFLRALGASLAGFPIRDRIARFSPVREQVRQVVAVAAEGLDVLVQQPAFPLLAGLLVPPENLVANFSFAVI
jgi:hypothetical protein